MSYIVTPPRAYWTIIATANAAFESVVGITPANPHRINHFFTAGLANFKVIAKNNYTLQTLSIVGALGAAGDASPGGGFPVMAMPGLYEALVWAEGDVAVGQGLVRPFQINTRNAASGYGDTDHNRIPIPIIPNFLQLAYSGATAGANPLIEIQVWLTFYGPMVQGRA